MCAALLLLQCAPSVQFKWVCQFSQIMSTSLLENARKISMLAIVTNICAIFCKSEIRSTKNWLWKHHGKDLGRTMKLKARKNSTVHCCEKKLLRLFDKKTLSSQINTNHKAYQYKYYKNKVYLRQKSQSNFEKMKS